jgi:hypothetical protein
MGAHAHLLPPAWGTLYELTAIAEHPIISNSEHAPNLPPSWAIAGHADTPIAMRTATARPARRLAVNAPDDYTDEGHDYRDQGG